MFWLCLSILVLLAGSIFILIARKGRQLRKNEPLPPKVTRAYLHWSENGKSVQKEIFSPFYLGKGSDNEIVVQGARSNYEVCIFYHDHRFAMQTPEGAGEVLVNGQEMIAGYLRDGDILVIADRSFAFRCS